MPTNRQADQMIGADLQQFLAPSQAYAANTYHVALIPGQGLPALGLKVGSLASFPLDVLYSGGKYLDLVIDITNANGGTLTVNIAGVDPLSGKSFTILTSLGLAANGTTVLRVGPALTPAANLTVNDFIPFTWNLQLTVATATMTFSISASQMP
jgi:hypothetical protein